MIFLATLSASIIVLFSNLFISKTLGPKSFGDFRTMIYLFAFLPIIADLGINSTLTKYIAEFGKNSGKSKYIINRFLKIKFLSYLFLIVIIFLIKDYIAIYFLKDISLNYLVIAGIILLAFNFFLSFSFIILGFQNFKLFSLSQFLNSSSSALLAVLLSPFGIFYMILGWGFGPLISNLASVLFLIKQNVFTNYEKVDVKKIFLKFSLPVYPIDLTTYLFNAIIPFLSLFFLQKLIGYYSFVFMFYLATLLIPNSLSFVLFPKVSELNGLKRYDHAKNILRKSFLYYSLVAIIGLSFVFLFSEWFISAISKDYLPSLFMFKVIVSLGFIFGYVIIYNNYLKGLGKVKKYALFTLAQNILMIIISFVLLNIM